jgi:putative transposase
MSKTRKTFKFRLFPTKRQRTILGGHLALCCELYNAALQERRDAWRINRKSISFRSQSDQLPAIKTDRPDVGEVYAQVLQDVLHRVDRAFHDFFRRVRRGEKAGFPRFRSRRRYNSFTHPQPCNVLKAGKLRLWKIGDVRIQLHRPIEGKVKTLTIIRSSTGKWFACFSVEVEPVPLPVNTEAVGVDVGLTHFATLSTGEQIPNPRFFREEQNALAKASRRLSAEKKGTPERRARRKIVARVHERIKFRRHDFAHQLSRYLVNRFGLIVFEDLNIAGMVKNHCLAKSIGDAAWSQLFQFTNYKAENAGGLCKQIDPRNTSRLTFCCGEMVEMALSDRVIHCPKCHSTTDRDWNASLNILSRGLATLGIKSVEAPEFIRGE